MLEEADKNWLFSHPVFKEYIAELAELHKPTILRPTDCERSHLFESGKFALIQKIQQDIDIKQEPTE